MNKRDDKVIMDHHDFKQLMREYKEMAEETGNERLLAKCATLCMNQIATDVSNHDDVKRLFYESDDSEYRAIAFQCLNYKG